jgi:hypothetical protein
MSTRKELYTAIASSFTQLAALENEAPPVVVEPPVEEPPVVIPPAEPPAGALILGYDNSNVATMARPARGAPVTDPAYGLQVQAATAANDGGTAWTRNEYSRRQPFNCNETLYIAHAAGGFWWLYDAATSKPILRFNNPLGGDCEPVWHPTDPLKIYHVGNNGGMTLHVVTIDLAAKSTTSAAAASLAGKLPWATAARCWTKSEGSPSRDGRYWCFQAETSGFGILGAFVYDLVAQKVVSTIALTVRPDHSSMSPCGKYAILSADSAYGTSQYKREDFSLVRQLHHKSEHSDLGLLPNGNSFYAALDFQSANGDVFWVDLETGAKKVLFSTYGDSTTSIHFSARCFDQPGLLLCSTYGNKGKTKKWFHYKLFLLNVQTGKVANLAHHRCNVGSYETEPQAAISISGRKVLFNSNYGGAELSAFRVDLTAAQLAQLR